MRCHLSMREALKNLWLLPRWGWGFPGGAVVKNPPANAGDARDWVGTIPGWGRSPVEGNGNPLWDSYLENPVDMG